MKQIARNFPYLLLACHSIILIPSAFAQPVHSPGSTVPLYAGCFGWPGGNPTSCYLTITSRTWGIDTNGHTAAQHSVPAPRSAFVAVANAGIWTFSSSASLANSNWAVSLRVGQRDNHPNYTDPRKMVGQDEYLQACAGASCSNYSYTVGWTDIYWVEEKPQWIHIGANSKHMNSNSYNHWMMSIAAYGIYDTAVAFLAANPTQGKIAVNDMSLPRGGLFDLSGQWQPSHWNHQRGKAVDVRALVTGEYSIPDAQANQFVNMCVEIGGAGYGQVEVPAPPLVPHIHCEWY